MPGPDPIFEVRNAFFLGNFQGCINESLRSNEKNREKDLFMYRAFLAQKKYGVVLNEVNDNMGLEFKAIRLLANYLSGDSSTKQRVMEEVVKVANGSHEPDEYVHRIVAAQILFTEKNYVEALSVLHGSDQIECSAFMVQTLLRLDRPDLALKELRKMQERDEDSTITQLANAWIYLSNGCGGKQLEEAYYIFHDLSAKYGSTPLLLNGQAVSLIARGKYQDAEPLLQQSLEKDSDNPETLINLMVLSSFLGKAPEVGARFMNQLKDSNPTHSFISDVETKEQELDYLVKQYSK